MECDPTRVCELLVGLGDVEVLGVDDAAGGPLRVHIRCRQRRPLSFPPFLGGLVYAAWACSCSMGLAMLLVECRRRGLYQVSIQAAMSRRAWSRVCQRRREMSSCWRVEKNDSAAALSSALPVRPMDWVTPRRRQASAKSPEVY